jgi:RNA polymerase sigma factor (sigma-70 family)
MSSDEQLMTAYQNGSEDAFNGLYSRYSSMVYGYARKRLKSSEADDFYQNVWRHLHEKKQLYAGQPFAPWFFVLIRNLLIDDYRSAARSKKHVAMEANLNSKAEETRELNDMLKELPEETATLIRKYYLEGFEYEELAIETGMSQTGLRKRLSRALQGLKDKFEV